MIKYFCVSDIHSFYKPLMKALSEKGFELGNKNHKLLLLGDAFDRGDDTIKVFEFLKQLKKEDRLVYVMGNHEELLFDCYADICRGYTPGSHHFHNGTVKTISMICGEVNDYHVYWPKEDAIRNVTEKTQELRDFIRENCVNYFTLGNIIFVHSWIPLKYESEIYPLWDANANNLSLEDARTYNDHWSAARWGNPFLMWKNKLYPEGKCIVFGHFHTSYGHSRIDMKCKEWPQKNKVDWQSAFKPWIKDNAIGLDACVAYSGFINCLVFDENGELVKEDAE